MKSIMRKGVFWGLVIAMSLAACSSGDNGGGDNEEPVYRTFAYVANYGSSNVSAYAVNATTGALTPISGSPFAAGGYAASIALGPSGRYIYVASASSGVLDAPGNVSGFAVHPATGVLTAVPGLPIDAGSTSFAIATDPAGKFAYVTNFDSNDISAYAIDASTGALTPIAGSPFSETGGDPFFRPGPSGIAVEAMGKFVYVAHYYDPTITAYAIDAATGELTPIAGSPFATADSSYSFAVDPTGKFAYHGNWISDSVSAFTIDAATGALAPVAGSPFATGAVGSSAWSVTVHPVGKFAYVVNRSADSVTGYVINPTTGGLTVIAGSPFATGPDPRRIAFDPMGKFAYVANAGADHISAYAVDTTTGALTVLAGSPFAAGSGPTSIVTVRFRQ